MTRPTLYRNFADRQAMYEAVLERDLRRLSEAIATDGTDPLSFLRHATEMMRVYDRFLSRLVEMADYNAWGNQARMAAILAAPLRQAQRSGAMRGDLTAEDVLIACRMLASHWKLDNGPDFAAVFERRLALLAQGLQGSSGGPALPTGNQPS